MGIYNWYKIKEIGRNIFGFKTYRTVYKSIHPDHLALWIVNKDWNSYKIFKNEEEVIFPPQFVVNPAQLTMIKMAEFADYLKDWENNPEIENPTGL